MNKVISVRPKVSIIIPVYNGSDYLRESISSALLQTYQNTEVIVVNDGSNDNGATREIALSYGDRIRYFEKENGGVATALNLGINIMTGDYFSWLSHDDIYNSDKVAVQMNRIIKMGSNNTKILFSDFDLINECGNHLQTVKLDSVDEVNFQLWLTTCNILHGCTLLIPKKCFDECGYFDPTLQTTQDYDMWFRLAEKFKFERIPTALLQSRQHSNQGTRLLPKKTAEECNLLMIKFYLYLRCQGASISESLSMADSFWARKFYLAAYYAYSDIILNYSHILDIPTKLVLQYKKILSLLKMALYSKHLLRYVKSVKDNKDRFTLFFHKNIFGSAESRSGEGSSLDSTFIVRKELPKLLKKYKVSTFIDAPCGDFNWMKTVNLDMVDNYHGIDIVEEIISNNNQKYGNDKYIFICKDMIRDDLPQGDLLMCRDCLVHLSFNDGIKLIRNIKKAKIKYLLMTTFTDRTVNYDLSPIDVWRPLNMQLHPFYLPDPLIFIDEKCAECGNMFNDKALGLYKVENICI